MNYKEQLLLRAGSRLFAAAVHISHMSNEQAGRFFSRRATVFRRYTPNVVMWCFKTRAVHQLQRHVFVCCRLQHIFRPAVWITAVFAAGALIPHPARMLRSIRICCCFSMLLHLHHFTRSEPQRCSLLATHALRALSALLIGRLPSSRSSHSATSEQHELRRAGET